MGSSIKTIGVYPLTEFENRKNLLHAFERLFPVKFEAYNESKLKNFDALFFIGKYEIPSSVFASPLLICNINLSHSKETGHLVNFTSSDKLDKRLRNRNLSDKDYTLSAKIKLQEDDIILASLGKEPVWIKRRNNEYTTDIIISSIPELVAGDSLRIYMIRNGFFSLIPVIHFLREITKELSYIQPALRAAFIIDDANIRFKSYGGIKYTSLIKDAEKYNFHVSLAVIPLDLYWASGSSVKLIKQNDRFISLSIHGNNHVKNEMQSCGEAGGHGSILAQVMNRVKRFENKYDLKISKVLIPPYGFISSEILSELCKYELNSVCVSSQFKQLSGNSDTFNCSSAVSEWHPADFIMGFPVINRRFPPSTKSEILLAAFLDQPVIIRYHPKQVVRVYNNLLRKAKFINSLPGVEWKSLEDISLSNFAYRITGNNCRIRMFSSKIQIDIPGNIENVIIEIPFVHGLKHIEMLYVNCKTYQTKTTDFGYETGAIPVSEINNGLISISISELQDYSKIKYPVTLKPLIKRIITESRDRLFPLFNKFSGKKNKS